MKALTFNLLLSFLILLLPKSILAESSDRSHFIPVKIKTKSEVVDGHILWHEEDPIYEKNVKRNYATQAEWIVYKEVLSFQGVPVITKSNIIKILKKDFISLELPKSPESYDNLIPSIVSDKVYNDIKDKKIVPPVKSISFTNYPGEASIAIFYALTDDISYKDLFLLQIKKIFEQSNGNEYGNTYPLEFPNITDPKANLVDLKKQFNELLMKIGTSSKICTIHTCVDLEKIKQLIHPLVHENVLISSHREDL